MGNEERELRVDETILGMSLDAINSAADELSHQADPNKSVGDGSYLGFIDTMKKGREQLSKHEGYNKGTR